jgi:acetyl esterase/lipase
MKFASKQAEKAHQYVQSIAQKMFAAATKPGGNPTEVLQAIREITDEYALVVPETMELVPNTEVMALEVGGRKAEWIMAPGANTSHRLLYIHGGGWVAGGLYSHRPLASRLSQASGYSVLLIDYALAPEKPYPQGLNDCESFYDFILNHGPDGDSKVEKLAVGGDSAGGNLALALTLRLKNKNFRLPDRVFAFSPMTDLSCNSETFETRSGVDPIISFQSVKGLLLPYLQNGEDFNHEEISPLNGDLKGFPPIQIHAGDYETLSGDSIMFVEKAKKQGVDATLHLAPECVHIFPVFAPYLPEAVDAITSIGKFLSK